MKCWFENYPCGIETRETDWYRGVITMTCPKGKKSFLSLDVMLKMTPSERKELKNFRGMVHGLVVSTMNRNCQALVQSEVEDDDDYH